MKPAKASRLPGSSGKARTTRCITPPSSVEAPGLSAQHPLKLRRGASDREHEAPPPSLSGAALRAPVSFKRLFDGRLILGMRHHLRRNCLLRGTVRLRDLASADLPCPIL